ncbi:MAG: prephenate dehydrogenase [Vicinamibacterales bacterium]
MTQMGRPPESGPATFARIGIVGLGLIGGSVALAARRAYPTAQVIGVDHADVLEVAMQRHAIDVGAADPIILADADLIVLAAPVLQNLQVLESLKASVQTPAVITDTGSTKRQMADAARRLPERLTFVGGHPLAGAAVGGLAHAHPDLFQGRPWLFTPAADIAPTVLARLLAFAQALGARPSVMGVDAHDRMLAFLSHLPQLTASALMDVVGSAVQEEGLAFAGRGLVDTTRLASSPADIWRDIVATNADQVGAALDTLIALLQELRHDIGRGERLTEVFQAANQWRQALPK